MNPLKSNISSLFSLFSQDTKMLEQIVKDYPASSLARILLAKKYKEENNPGFERFREEASFYMGNVPWYLFSLSMVGDETPSEDLSAAQADVGSKIEAEEEILGLADPVAAEDNPAEMNETDEEESEGARLTLEEVLPDEISEPEWIPEEPLHAAEVGREDETEFQNGQWQEEKTSEESEAIQPEDEYPDDEASAETEEQQPANEDVELTNELVGANMDFEPLHTIDYFASQGIKLREEDLKDDRLSQQVKSFTGWLKSMKQLHPGRLPEQNEVIEKIIQNAAEISNVGPDVLTEAMADVLVKQNKKDKAIEMYQKLSLMNPSKSAYFAAKIENLKTI